MIYRNKIWYACKEQKLGKPYLQIIGKQDLMSKKKKKHIKIANLDMNLLKVFTINKLCFEFSWNKEIQ